METVGVVGLGKIGLPIAENLIKSGYRVLGYRRSSLAELEKIGGTPARSAADIGEQTDIVLTCLPSAEALDDVVQGPRGLVHSARPGQIVVELGSHLIPEKERQIAPLAAKGAVFIDGEVGGTPGMVSARKAVVYLAGDAEAAKKAEAVARGFSDIVHYFGPFGSASKVKLVNNLLVAIHIAATAEAMALGLKAGVDVDLMIKAVSCRPRAMPSGCLTISISSAISPGGSAWRRRCLTARRNFMRAASTWASAHTTMRSWST